MVLDEANKRFAPIWEPDSAKVDVLNQYCDTIDRISDLNNGETFDVEVDEIAMTIKIVPECPDLVSENNDNLLE